MSFGNRTPERRPFSPAALAGIVLGVVAGAGAAAAGLGSRFGLWDFRTGIAVLRGAAYIAPAAIAVSLWGCVTARPGAGRRGFYASGAGLLLGLAAFALPFSTWQTVQRVPMIHDISTDTHDPPRFVAVLPLRRDAANPAEYGGPEVAAKQREAYPDIKPVIVPVPPEKAFEQALSAARKMGWAIADANPREGRIEATDTTFWFGFKDDVVVRIVPDGTGSRVDVRSVSRVGKSDIGTNARRIRRYLEALGSRAG